MPRPPFYVTTPIYYPSGEPHLGHAYTTLCADTLARAARLAGRDTFFLTGTDEHGQKMVDEAEKLGIAPADLADRMMARFRDYFAEIDITNDDFIRTSQPRHKDAVAKIVQTLLDNGDIYPGTYAGWYDTGEEAFVTETDAKANDYKSPVSGRPLTRYEEPSYFFRLSEYAPRVLVHLEANPDFVRPAARHNEVVSKLKAGVADLSVSRASLKWGVPMPNDPGHVVYVWIDALSNYVTALDFPDGRRRFDTYWPASVHLIGKEILWFHAVYWPAILMAMDLPLPRTVFAHGWWTSEGRKMSKSLGNFVGLDELRDAASTYSLDALRYYLLKAAPFGSDLDWRDDELARAYAELANVLGNALNRILKMAARYRGGILPDPSRGRTGQDAPLLDATASLAGKVRTAYDTYALHDAATLPIDLARQVNAYVDATEPFKLAKDESQAARLDAVLATAADAMQQALLALRPVLPEKAAAGLRQMNAGEEPMSPGHRLGEGEPLFPRVEG